MNGWLVGGVAVLVALGAIGLTVRFRPVATTRVLVSLLRRVLGLQVRRVRVAGSAWTYLEGGDRNAPVMLFVHGFGADKDMWLTYSRQFSSRCRIIAPDLPGFGDAERQAELDYSPRVQARRLAAFCDALRIKDAHVVGSSMGGFISCWLAIDRADLVRTLTLMNAAGVFGTAPSVVQTAAESGGNPLVVEDDAGLDRLLALLSHRPLRLPRFLRAYLLDGYRQHQALLDRIFWQLVAAHEGEGLEAALGRIRAPTLVVWGSNDQIIDPSCATVFASRIPNATRVVLDDVGHVPMLEAPGATAAAQGELLAGRRG